jgi:hypothetical protein
MKSQFEAQEIPAMRLLRRSVLVPVLAIAIGTAGLPCLALADDEPRSDDDRGPDDRVPAESDAAPAESDDDDRDDPAAGLNQRELEEKFAEKMSGATLRGFFVHSKKGQISGLTPDMYRLGKVSKADAKGNWNIGYYAGETDLLMDMPPVNVEWAGKMPVIVFEKLKIKGMAGTFTARILIDGDQYSGTWSEGKKGGHMFGTISHEKPDESET